MNNILADSGINKRDKVLQINALVGLDAAVKMSAMRAAQKGETTIEVGGKSSGGGGGGGEAATPDGGVLRIYHANGARSIRVL